MGKIATSTATQVRVYKPLGGLQEDAPKVTSPWYFPAFVIIRAHMLVVGTTTYL